MKCQLYHGSNLTIDNIDLTRSKRGKDFGKGFYLNPDYDQALEWAKRVCSLLDEGQPTVNGFDFDIDAAIGAGLHIREFTDYSKEWADFVVLNRQNKSDEPSHEYDIVIGPIADDNVGLQIRRYIMGYMSVERLIEELSHKTKSIQYFFGTERALKYLTKL